MIDGPIQFSDDDGVRWSVDVHPAARSDSPDNELLVFTSEAGERRACNGCLPEGSTWQDVDARVWRALLRYADSGGPQAPSD